ncbi:MAG: hypothetical protein WDM86_02395 [Rhizomicrobium sp.]
MRIFGMTVASIAIAGAMAIAAPAFADDSSTTTPPPATGTTATPPPSTPAPDPAPTDNKGDQGSTSSTPTDPGH